MALSYITKDSDEEIPSDKIRGRTPGLSYWALKLLLDASMIVDPRVEAGAKDTLAKHELKYQQCLEDAAQAPIISLVEV